MRCWQVERLGAALVIARAELPEPGPGAVRLRVAAVGLDFADLLMRAGHCQRRPPLGRERHPPHLLVRNPVVTGFWVCGHLDHAPDVVAASLATLLRWRAEGSLRARPPLVLPVAALPEALAHLRAQGDRQGGDPGGSAGLGAMPGAGATAPPRTPRAPAGCVRADGAARGATRDVPSHRRRRKVCGFGRRTLALPLEIAPGSANILRMRPRRSPGVALRDNIGGFNDSV